MHESGIRREIRRDLVKCTTCGAVHIDEKKWAAVNHRKHLCSTCGSLFYSPVACVGVAGPTERTLQSRAPQADPTPQKLVRCGPYHVPLPRVTTLDDTIEEAMKKPDLGWQEWLQKNSLWDDNLNERAAYTRYYKFHKVKFDALPPERWPTFYKRLAEMEDLFVVGDAIGEVPGQPFVFEVMDKTPIR